MNTRPKLPPAFHSRQPSGPSSFNPSPRTQALSHNPSATWWRALAEQSQAQSKELPWIYAKQPGTIAHAFIAAEAAGQSSSVWVAVGASGSGGSSSSLSAPFCAPPPSPTFPRSSSTFSSTFSMYG